MSMVYDNWERLVGAVMKREELRQIALCPSFSSTSSFSSDFSIDNHVSVLNRATGASGGGVAAGAARLFAAPAIALAWFRTRSPDGNFLDIPEVHMAQLKRFSLRELKLASSNFNNENILGRSAFGDVYKGRLADGSFVAIKRMDGKLRNQRAEMQFHTEVELIRMPVHPNLLRLYGFCMTQTEWLLVYPYMANGDVASHLGVRAKSQAPLGWPIRKRIALGSARGLACMHDLYDPKFIHLNVKGASILLDEDFEAVVGGFGLAKHMNYRDSLPTNVVRGTNYYIAPEYLSTGKFSEKCDVFGYGITLLELITGVRAFNLAQLASADDEMLLDWVKGLLKEKRLETLVDADLEGYYIEEEVEQLIQLALLCTQFSPSERPTMSQVVRMLQGYGLEERWEKYWQKEEISREERSSHPNTDWIIDDSGLIIPPDELSGPR